MRKISLFATILATILLLGFTSSFHEGTDVDGTKICYVELRFNTVVECAEECDRCYSGVCSSTSLYCPPYYENGEWHSNDCNQTSCDYYCTKEIKCVTKGEL